MHPKKKYLKRSHINSPSGCNQHKNWTEYKLYKKKNRTHKKATGTNKINAAMLQTTRSIHENVSTHQQWTL